jgi:hypothetical protein
MMTIDIDPELVYHKEAVGDAQRGAPPGEYDNESYTIGFDAGFAYALAVLSVCAFLDDLANAYCGRFRLLDSETEGGGHGYPVALIAPPHWCRQCDSGFVVDDDDGEA